jgi:hypothetical protein
MAARLCSADTRESPGSGDAGTPCGAENAEITFDSEEPANDLIVDRDRKDKAPYALAGTVKNVVFDLKPVEAAATHPHAQDLHCHAPIHGVAAGGAA